MMNGKVSVKWNKSLMNYAHVNQNSRSTAPTPHLDVTFSPEAVASDFWSETCLPPSSGSE